MTCIRQMVAVAAFGDHQRKANTDGTDRPAAVHHTGNTAAVPLVANIQEEALHNKDNHEEMAALSYSLVVAVLLLVDMADVTDGHKMAAAVVLHDRNAPYCDQLHGLPVAAWLRYRHVVLGSCKQANSTNLWAIAATPKGKFCGINTVSNV